MKPTKTLIAALLSAADRIESSTSDYCWTDPMRCNCGILAQELLHIDRDSLLKLVHREPFQGTDSRPGVWSNRADSRNNFCPTTGLPKNTIFKALYAHGLEQKDFFVLENLGDGRSSNHYSTWSIKDINRYGTRDNPHDVARFFRRLATMLQKRRDIAKRLCQSR